MNMRTLLAALVSALVASTAAASAPTEAVVVVPMDQRSDEEALVLDRSITRWVSRSAQVDVVDVSLHAQGTAFEEMNSRLERARSVRDSGIEAYDMMDYQNALMRLERAIESYEQVDLTEHLDELLDTYFMRALALFYEGQPSRARNQILDIYALKRDFTPDRGRVTPEIEALLEDGKRAADEAPPTTLEVQTEPVPARIYVDGQYKGISPIELNDLQPGHHFVSARAPGYAYVQERHLAAPGQIALLRMEFTSRGRELLSRAETLRIALADEAPAQVAISLAEWAEAEQVLAVGVSRKDRGVELVGWRFAADGHLISHAKAQVSDVQAEAEISTFLDDLHGFERPRGPEGEPVPELNPKGSFSFDFQMDHRGWGLVAAGTGAATAVGAIFVGLSASNLAVEARDIPQLDVEDYEAAMKTARTRAMITDGMYVTGALIAGAGIYLFLQEEAPWSRSDGMREGLSLGMTPGPGGAMVSVGGRF